jgi:hypothetical protein
VLPHLRTSHSITAEAGPLGRRVCVLGRGLKVPAAAHVGYLAGQEAPLVVAQEWEAAVVEACDFLGAVDCVTEGVALYVHEEEEGCAARQGSKRAWWRHQPSFPQLPEEMSAGGVRKI